VVECTAEALLIFALAGRNETDEQAFAPLLQRLGAARS
jgi:hypothetical protein